MSSLRLRSLVVSAVLGTPLLVAFACTNPAERLFDDPPVDGNDTGGNSSSSGGQGGDGTGGNGGSVGKPPDVIDGPAPNPGCDPPELVEPLVVQSLFPADRGAASGAHVVLDFGNLSKDCSVLECRFTYGDDPTGDWTTCGLVGTDRTKARPFTDEDSQNADKNGAYSIDVRERFDGAAGPVFRHRVYLHDSLHGVETCPRLGAEDDEILEEARDIFEAGRAGITNGRIADPQLASPFVRMKFAPPLFSALGVGAGAGQVEYKSLRRRFVLSDDGTLVLMKRIYPSRRNSSHGPRASDAEYLCHATGVHVHTQHNVVAKKVPCDAVVMNSHGFGLCLEVSDSGDVSRVYTTTWASNVGPESANTYFANRWDSFMWRKLMRNNSIPRGGQYQPTYFSPKCDDSEECFEHDLFLPHREFLLD